MNPHHHLHKSVSNSNLSNLSKDSCGSNGSGSGSGSGRARAKLLSKINKLIRPTDSILGGLKSSPSPRSTTTISDLSSVDPFQIVHERDEKPMYTPTRPTLPRTNSECQEALEEMFAHTRNEGAERRSEEMQHAKSMDVKEERPHPDQRRPPPPLSSPKVAIIPPRPVPVAPRMLQIPAGPRTAGARLETIPASPLTLVTMHSLSTSTIPAFPKPPSTPRTTNSKGIHRALSLDNLHVPRPLSERAILPLDPKARLRQGEHALSQHSLPASSPLSTSSTTSQQDGQQMQSSPGPLRRSPLSALPVRVISPNRTAFTSIAETIRPPATTPAWPRSCAATERKRPRPQMTINSMRANNPKEVESDGQDDQTVDVSSTTRSGHASRIPLSAKCYMCPQPCKAGMGLCDACQARSQPPNTDFDSSDSDYEDIEVRTPTLSPCKAKPLSIPVVSSSSPSSSRTPPRSHDGTPSSDGTPKTPRAWSRIPTPIQQHDSVTTSLSVSPTPYVAQQLKVFPSPPLRQVSIASPISPWAHSNGSEEPGSALYHLERSIRYDDWQPLTPGATPAWGQDMIRVGSVQSGEGRRVVVRNSNDENADTMKMLADENVEPRHEAGGSYGDWFSYYAEREGNEAPKYVDDAHEPHPSSSSPSALSCDLFCGLPNRASSGSSIYDRIMSIYDAYAELPVEEEEVGMF